MILKTRLHVDTPLELVILALTPLQQNKFRYILVSQSGHILLNSSMKDFLWSLILFFSFSLCVTASLLHSMKLDYMRLCFLLCQCFKKYYSKPSWKGLCHPDFPRGSRGSKINQNPEIWKRCLLLDQAPSSWTLSFLEMVKSRKLHHHRNSASKPRGKLSISINYMNSFFCALTTELLSILLLAWSMHLGLSSACHPWYWCCTSTMRY